MQVSMLRLRLGEEGLPDSQGPGEPERTDLEPGLASGGEGPSVLERPGKQDILMLGNGGKGELECWHLAKEARRVHRPPGLIVQSLSVMLL